MNATPSTTAATPPPRPRDIGATTRRGMLGLGLGNTLEWYDWMVFGLLSAFLGPHFFPAEDPVSATLSALAVFAVGFAVRPLGGVLFGVVADLIGRRRVMLASVGLMAVTTLVIALTPTYETIGAWAGVILVVCRLLQGVSTGIEAPLSTAYAVELNPAGREGRAAGYISFFVNLGILLASLVSFATSWMIGGDAMQEWGWRVPFVIGALLGVVVIYLRRALPETLHEHERADNSTGTVWRGVGRHWLGLLAIVFVVGAAQAYNYAWNVGLPNLARSTFGEDPTAVFALTTALGVVLLVGSLVTGALADRYKLSRTFLVTRLLAVPSVFLMLFYDEPGILGFAAVLLGGSVVLVLNMTLYNVVATSLMPKACRATGVALGYGVAVALFGGTASYLLVWLQQRELDWLFPTYTAVLSLVSVVLYVAARRHSGTFAGE
ncbi:MFS transporter [Pseudonocardia kunmingensis]|uniref:MHS family alpha-ketoglutarate permease-like MFS transporter n=1 Tax=Pseudonocardia kunmingensis TaxID=630975 RepID=A0A543DNJ0_9PSEU|nr:MFS transporter [Pseudonocardia kunmingensis]TQM10890.1 MHS family alpha-ketoglutarate permease-like MFS transporter [Pseudonocardia kunmingensis]